MSKKMTEAGYSSFELSDGEFKKTVYSKGKGPGIIIMHELPGMSPETIIFANYLVKQGFTVYLPLLFGEPMMAPDASSSAKNMASLCISKEFHLFTSNKTSPIVHWLRALCRHAHEACGGPGVGAIGMCLTGGFAIPLMVEPAMMAPALSQPSLPINPIVGKDSLGCSEEDYQAACARARRDNMPIIGFRFSHDALAAKEKFDRLHQDLGELFIDETIDSSLGNENGLPIYAHSVMTLHFQNNPSHPTHIAREKLLEFYKQRLLHKDR